LNKNEKSSQSAWRALQEISRKERERAKKIYDKIKSLIDKFGYSIPTQTVLKELGFNTIDEMIHWEMEWLPRKELNVKFEYKDDMINIEKDAFDDEELGIYEFL